MMEMLAIPAQFSPYLDITFNHSSKSKTTTMFFPQAQSFKPIKQEEESPEFNKVLRDHDREPSTNNYTKELLQTLKKDPTTSEFLETKNDMVAMDIQQQEEDEHERSELATDDSPKPSMLSISMILNEDARPYYSEVHDNQLVNNGTQYLVDALPSLAHISSMKRKIETSEPLPSIWSQVPQQPTPPDLTRAPVERAQHPHAELLLYLRNKVTSQPPLQIAPTHTIHSIQPARTSPPNLPTTPNTQRPRRANDYTGEFKREFCVLLSKHAEARAQWEHFWRRRECTGRRPCIKSYLAFCDLFAEFTKLRRSHKYRVLGTRTNCECSYPVHALQSSTQFNSL